MFQLTIFLLQKLDYYLNPAVHTILIVTTRETPDNLKDHMERSTLTTCLHIREFNLTCYSRRGADRRLPSHTA